MRIVAGSARGRPLRAPRGTSTRPTSDKVRGAVFNLLGQFFDGGRALDLYAGSGALALEALSRGAAAAVCVETDPRALDCLRDNARRCGFEALLEVRAEPVERAVPRLPAAAFFLAFLDPPYAVGPEAALRLIERVLAPGGSAVAEHDPARPPPERVGSLALAERRRYGGTGISIYRRE